METQPSKAARWTSYIISGIVILFMLMDSIMKFIKPTEVIEATLALGFKESHLATMGSLGLISTLLYIYPRTAILGSVLLTGYFGGAMATHVRLDNPLFTHILFTGYLSIMMWGGLWLRNFKLRELFPVVK
ncbi:MAG: DoxX family protein [Cytophagales bacterium]|nr:DoxX family protein [Cytophagales bacterium]